jgi:ATP-dependent DNA ligase
MGWVQVSDHQGRRKCAALLEERRGIQQQLPRMRRPFAESPTNSAILDGELCLIDPGGGANVYRLMHVMRTRSPDESQLMFLAFDLRHPDGVDLRGLPLSERKHDLHRALRQIARAVHA